MSLVLREPPALLPLIAAVAVCDVIGERAAIKWPNDVVFARGDGLAKVAGILVEGRPQEGWAVLGIGLNVAVRPGDLPLQLRATAASLELQAGGVEGLLDDVLKSLGTRLGEPADATLAAWRARDALHGRLVRWAGDEGRAGGIDGEGRLVVVRAGGGRTELDAGEVHLSVLPARSNPGGS
jgi:BirA family biotin operon repressor/biotin-[acetyl-CoA-carboxylase] ligase